MMRLNLFIKIVFPLLLSQIIYAGGTDRTFNFGAKHYALNGIYVGGIEGVSNIFFNPAGLAFKNNSALEVTGLYRQEEQSLVDTKDLLRRSLIESDVNFGAGFYFPVTENLVFGAGLGYSTFYKVKWPYVLLYKNNASLVTAATDMNNEYLVRNYSAAIAYKMNSFSVGLTVNVLDVRNNLAFAQDNYAWTGDNGLPAYQFDYNQKGMGFNLNFGVLYQVDDNLRFGLSVVNGTTINMSGTAFSRLYELTDSVSNLVDLESEFQTPWSAALGCVYKITDDITLNVDVKYNLYSNVQEEVKYNFDNDVWQNNSTRQDSVTGLNTGSLAQYYNNSFDAGFGLEYRAASDLDLFAGYRFSQSPNSGKSYSLLNPDVSRHLISGGFSYRSEELTIEGSLQYYIGIENSVTESMIPVNNGKYDLNGIIPSLTFKYNL